LARESKSDKPRLSMQHLDGIEEQIELLKVAYERYFNGVDRVPPARTHDAVKLAVRNLVHMQTGSTAVRFRAQNLKARLVTYEHYWTRILLQIERGTFKRLLAESKRREYVLRFQQAEEAIRARTGSAGEPGDDGLDPPPVSEADAPVQRVHRPSSKPLALPTGMESKEARDLFKQFVAAKKAAGESTDGLTYGHLVEKIARELPKLQEKHGDGIRFEVATEGGKVRLRARRRPSQASG
jgi:hypothetical protein